ncbi:MAG: histidine kinase dimerization/phospho-acceptor domain-containing protein [Eubacteriales bacterium]
MKDDRYMEVSAERSGDGRCDLLTFRDVTVYRRRMEDYEKRLLDAEEASQSKTTFLSRMSHEIRTPINGISGMLTLAEGKLSRPIRRVSAWIRQARCQNICCP